MQDTPTPQPVRPGPSRDMLGGPWLGVGVFVIIAIGLGWGLISLFQQMAAQTASTLDTQTLDHGFDPDTVYTVKRDLLLGYTADGRKALFPARADLPEGTRGKRSAPRLDEVKDMDAETLRKRDLAGIVTPGTRVQFVEVIEDPRNPQTRLLIMVRLLDGEHAGVAPVLGMHLESADSTTEPGETRYVPRPELFQQAEPTPGQVQSSAPDTDPQEADPDAR